MKVAILLICLTFSSCEYNLEMHQDIVHKINKLRTTWKAEVSNLDITPLLGAWEETDETRLPEKTEFETADDDLPESFDLREKYPECETIKEIRDQSKCGSCWAFAAGEVMSDRLCIFSKGQLQIRVSTQDIVSCCRTCGHGCKGGREGAALSYWKNSGVPSGGLYGDKTTCKPYFLPPCDDHMHKCHDYQPTPKCEKKCIPEYPKEYEEDKTYASKVYSVSREENIMKEIYENGSVTASFMVFADFADYKSGIYQHVFGSYQGGHAVKIIGWGVENGVKYWIIANSWNPTWGENGYFRMIKGEDECGIETGCNAAIPKL